MNDDDKVQKALREMRESLDQMTGHLTQMLNSLPESHTATQALLEKVVPAWDAIAQNELIEASPEWHVLILLSDGVKAAIFDLDERLSALESQ